MSYTKGDWEIIDEGFDEVVIGVYEPDRDGFYQIVEMGDLDEETKANACLIRAAPVMLEALEMVADADDDARADGNPGMPLCARAKIDAAIAKARGES